MMKLRMRSVESQETRNLEVSVDCTIQELKSSLSYSLFYTRTFAYALRLSLNAKDELSSRSPAESLLSIGITPGHLIYYKVYFSSPAQGQVNVRCNRNVRPKVIHAAGKSETEEEKLEIKRFSEPDFLRRVLLEYFGSHLSDNKLIFLAIHAVFLETGLRVDLFDILKKRASTNFTTSVRYTFPQLLSDNNDITQSIVVKFQTLGHFVNVYGCDHSGGLHRLNIDTRIYVPAIRSFRVKVILEFWKFVKDGIVLPLLMELCEKTGSNPPPCLIQLPADLQIRILELVTGQDIARVACVCKHMKYLCSNDELWKEKYMSEFGSETGGGLGFWKKWKAIFASSWENNKKRAANSFAVRLNPFGTAPNRFEIDLIAPNLFGFPPPNPFGMPVDRFGLPPPNPFAIYCLWP